MANLGSVKPSKELHDGIVEMLSRPTVNFVKSLCTVILAKMQGTTSLSVYHMQRSSMLLVVVSTPTIGEVVR